MAYFSAHPEQFNPADPAIEAMPRFLAIILPVGVLGVVVAGMFAADMSTYNAYLLAWSGIITQDVVAPLCGKLGDQARLTINRALIVLIGAFILWMGLFYNPPDTFILYQQLTGTIYLSGAAACVVLGLYWKRANTAGAFAATLVGVAFPVTNLYVQRRLKSLPAWLSLGGLEHWLTNGWYAGLIAFALAFAMMIVVSLLAAPWARSIELTSTESNPSPC